MVIETPKSRNTGRKSTTEFTSKRKQLGSSENIYSYAKRGERERWRKGAKSSTYPGKCCLTQGRMQYSNESKNHYQTHFISIRVTAGANVWGNYSNKWTGCYIKYVSMKARYSNERQELHITDICEKKVMITVFKCHKKRCWNWT